MIEKILERLEEVRMRYFLTIANGGNEKLDCAYVYVGKAIDQCKAIVQEVAKDGGWISCSERLPNSTDNVLITTRYGVVLMVFLGISKNWCYLNGKRITDSQDMPIAWQPLPAPYQKGE